MVSVIIRRIFITLPLLLVITFFIFSLQELAPGDFLSRFRQDPTISTELLHAYEKEFNLDKPFLIRFGSWCINALQGDFGYSFSYRMPVMILIVSRLTNTLYLALASLLIALVFGIPGGITSAVYKNQMIDKIIRFMSYVFMSIPSIFLALVMIFIAARTQIFPVGGVQSINFETMNAWSKIKDLLWHLILPASVLGVSALAHYMRQTRAQMLEVLNEDYIRVARAKGLHPAKIIGKHAFANTLNSLITLVGYSLGFLLNGSFLVEIIMGWPGMARLTIDALFNHDGPLLMASCVVASCALIMGNLIADILLTLVDPRISIK